MSETGSTFIYYKTAGNAPLSSFIEKAYLADNSLIELLAIDFEGKDTSPLIDPRGVLISQELAKKICNAPNVDLECIIGKPIFTKEMGGSETEWIVRGILNPLPSNTHFKYDALFSLEREKELLKSSPALNAYTYVRAKSTFDLFDFNQSLVDKEKLAQLSYQDQDYTSLRPIESIHLSPSVSNSPEESTSRSFVIFMMITGIIILLLASTNFINSSIIRSIERSKEVGVRRLVGIQPRQLLINILLESFIFNTIAAILSIGLFVLALGFSATLADLKYPEQITGETLTICAFILLGLVLFSTLASAYYPAKMLIGLKPVEALKGSSQIIHTSQSSKGSLVMRSLLIFQLTISIIFISGMYIVQEQLSYVKNNDVTSFRMNLQAKSAGLSGANELYAEMGETFLNESLNKGTFLDIYASNTYKGQIKSKQIIKGLRPIDADTSLSVPDFNLFVVDHKHFMGLDDQLLEGRNFNERFGFDYNGAIINEAALNAMGLNIKDNVIGTKIAPYNGFLKIIGVLKNKTENEAPQIFVTGYRYPVYFSVNVQTAGNSAEKLQAVVARTERILNDQFNNTYVITRKYEDQFTFEAALVNLFYVFTGLAVLIASLGIYALSAFTAIKRTKEIGIRKILGARVIQILYILTSDFMKLMLIGSAIAVPLIFLLARKWLDDYGYRIDLGPKLFLLPILAMALLSLIIVIRQCWSTSILAPLKSLRAE